MKEWMKNYRACTCPSEKELERERNTENRKKARGIEDPEKTKVRRIIDKVYQQQKRASTGKARMYNTNQDVMWTNLTI